MNYCSLLDKADGTPGTLLFLLFFSTMLSNYIFFSLSLSIVHTNRVSSLALFFSRCFSVSFFRWGPRTRKQRRTQKRKKIRGKNYTIVYEILLPLVTTLKINYREQFSFLMGLQGRRAGNTGTGVTEVTREGEAALVSGRWRRGM